MDQAYAHAFGPRAIGTPIYRQDGELYDQIPRSGRRISKIHALLGAIIDFCGGTNATEAMDKDLSAKTNIHLRTIQRILRALEDKAIGLIKRQRGGGRRVIEIPHLRDKLPKPEKPARATTPAAAPAEPETFTPEQIEMARWAALEWAPQRGWRLILTPKGDDYTKEPIPGATQDDLTRDRWETLKRLYRRVIVHFLKVNPPQRE